MAEEWPVVYSLDDLQAMIARGATPALQDGFWAPVPSQPARPDCQGDLVRLPNPVVYVDETGEPCTVEHSTGLWLVLGNTCDLDRELTDVATTQVVPVYDWSSDDGIDEDLPALRAYKFFRSFYVPPWEAGGGILAADLTWVVTVHKQALFEQGTLVARMSRAGWTLFHACLVRYLCRADGRET